MATLSDLQALLDKLRMARASGLRAIQHGDERAEYKSDGEMATAIADIERRIAGLQGGRITTVKISSSKGL
jgi:hypothetical protein